MFKALRILRVFNDMSATELAHKLKISKSFLSEIESGKKRVDMKLLDAYAKVFHIRASTIVLLDESINNESGDLKHWIVRQFGKLLLEVEHEGTRKVRNIKKSTLQIKKQSKISKTP
jgi:transcriptional regulator with XRE-family HTH domain